MLKKNGRVYLKDVCISDLICSFMRTKQKHRFSRYVLKKSNFATDFFHFTPFRGVWSRRGCVCSDFRDRTRKPVAPHYKGSWSQCAGDILVPPPQTERSNHILPYIQVIHSKQDTLYCTPFRHKN